MPIAVHVEPMSDEDLRRAVLALFAYDRGATDTGVFSPDLRSQVLGYLESLEERDFRITITRLFREAFFTEAAIARGYGIRDALSLTDWFADNGIDL